jgi:hypothetical protein
MPAMGAQVIELTAYEIHQILERGAHERLRMNAHDMLKAYRAGELRDPGSVADLLAYARLLSPDDPLALGASRPRA